MKNITLFIASSVLCFLSAPAFAQDAAPFTGPRAEIVTGYDVVDAKGVNSAEGLLYGLNLGYDFAAGGLILGVEAEVADSTTKKTIGGASTVTDRDLYVGGRIGMPLGDRTLAYVKAGYSNARLESHGAIEGVSFDDGANLDGVRLGAGVEHRLSEALFVKGEYRYSNYEQGVSRHQLLAGLGVRF